MNLMYFKQFSAIVDFTMDANFRLIATAKYLLEVI